MPTPRTRLALAVALGAAVTAFAPAPAGAGWPPRILVGWVVTASVFVAVLVRHIAVFDAEQTRAVTQGDDGNRTETDAVVVLASIGSLVAIGWMLATKGGGPAVQTYEGIVAVVTVAASWVSVHAVYTLRYARHWYAEEPGWVELDGSGDAPVLADFAYLAFTLGMTYQVSDTSIKTTQGRRLVLKHTLLSYVFGTVVVAATLNLVIGLAG